MLNGNAERCPQCGSQDEPARESAWLIWVAAGPDWCGGDSFRRATGGSQLPAVGFTARAWFRVRCLPGALANITRQAGRWQALPEFGTRHR
jgi:hypothetical protein